MKKLFLLLTILSVAAITHAQFNLPDPSETDYCCHAAAAERMVKSYAMPVSSNPLLDHYNVTFYFLDLSVESNTVALGGNVTIKAFSTVNSLDTFACELIDTLTVDSVFVNGSALSYLHANDMINVPLSDPIPEGALFSVQVYYHGTPPTGEFFAGVTTDHSSQFDKDVTWSLSEPYAAKEWWPTKQDLTDKADSAWIFMTTSSGNMVGSEGLLTNVTTMPDGKLRYEWKCHHPIDYYLLSFAVADYQDYSIYAYPDSTTDSVLIQNFIYDSPGCLPYYQAAIDKTVGFVELFSNLFGLYPYIDEKYGHCLTELGGGMEHQTMTTIGNFSYGTVAHELGHMWFGDKVTCATWSDIWINEGFATYSDYLAHHFLANPYYDSLWLKQRHDNVKSEPGGSVYVPQEDLGDVGRIFDGRLSYNKGALILHMIRFELQDDDLFFNILRTYVQEYGDSVATGDDFRNWLEYKSGMDFTDFFNQWYYGQGFPIYDIVWNEHNGNLNITSTQSTSTEVTTLFKMHVPYHLNFSDGTDTTLLLYQDANLNHYVIPVEKSIDSIDIDPKQWIIHEVNSIILGIEDTGNVLYFTLAPNPAVDHFHVFFSHPVTKEVTLTISDLAGRKFFSKPLKASGQIIDVSKFARGIYLVTVSDGNARMNKKIIIE